MMQLCIVRRDRDVSRDMFSRFRCSFLRDENRSHLFETLESTWILLQGPFKVCQGFRQTTLSTQDNPKALIKKRIVRLRCERLLQQILSQFCVACQKSRIRENLQSSDILRI